MRGEDMSNGLTQSVSSADGRIILCSDEGEYE
jgi:hypothetical protein